MFCIQSLFGQAIPPMNERQINSEFQAEGYSLERPAMRCLKEYINITNDPEEALQVVIERVRTLASDSLVKKSLIEEIISSIEASASPTEHLFGFQNAYDAPCFKFDSSDRSLTKYDAPKGALGCAEDKELLFNNRYQILKTCLLHTQLFQASSLQFNIGSGKDHKITPIASLLSVGESDNVIILGYLDCDGSTNSISIEDPSGIIELDISQLQPAGGIFSAGSIVLVEGSYCDKKLIGSIIGHPPGTSFETFESRYWRLPTDPFGWELTKGALGKLDEMLTTVHSESLIVAMSDVWIDVPGVMENFNYALSLYDDAPPNILIISGSFTSTPFSFDKYPEFKKRFSKFCDIIKRHKTIYENTQIVIIPSLSDPSAPHVYPRPPLPASLQTFLDAPNVKFMTNPCRIRFLNQTITIFRDDLLKRLSNASVLPVPDQDAHKSMLTTIIDQRHLCPIDLEHAPIAWPYDHAMRLFPPPDVLVICDSCPAWTDHYCSRAFNPGQFGNGGTFVQYFPATKRAEIRSVE